MMQRTLRPISRLFSSLSASGRFLQMVKLSQCSTIPQRYSFAALHKCLTNSRCYSSQKETPVINIQDFKDFQERVINSEVPVVVDFHAKWCGPCKILGPRLESIVSDHKGKVILAKIDIDELDDLAIKYQVRAVPTVIAFKKGVSQNQFVGLLDDDQIMEFVEKLLL